MLRSCRRELSFVVGVEFSAIDPGAPPSRVEMLWMHRSAPNVAHHRIALRMNPDKGASTASGGAYSKTRELLVKLQIFECALKTRHPNLILTIEP
jgi:hypothetical protein